MSKYGELDGIGRCGILTAHITDPVAQLLSWWMTVPNAVGVYYTVTVQGQDRTIVRLYNTYDSTPVSWFRLGGSMDRLLQSGYCYEISFYPLPLPVHDSVYQALTAITREYTPLPHEKHRAYTRLLLGEKSEHTGYTIVNRIMNTALKRSSSIISSDRLMWEESTVPLTFQPPAEHPTTLPEESRGELVQLAAIFVELFSRSPELRAQALAQRHWPRLCALQTQIIMVLLGQKWDTATLSRLMAEANDHREILSLSSLPPPPKDTGPVLALGMYLESLHPQAPIRNSQELRALYNRLASVYDLPLLPIDSSPDLIPLERVQWAQLSDQELIQILSQLDALDVDVGKRNYLLAELALRRKERGV